MHLSAHKAGLNATLCADLVVRYLIHLQRSCQTARRNSRGITKVEQVSAVLTDGVEPDVVVDPQTDLSPEDLCLILHIKDVQVHTEQLVV